MSDEKRESAKQRRRIESLRGALQEIRDVAAASTGVSWYAMVASKALQVDESGVDDESGSAGTNQTDLFSSST